MKKKLDFITNSSSSSFIAWGITIDTETLKEKYGRKIFEIYKMKQDQKKDKKAKSQGAFMTVPSKETDEKLEEQYEDFLEEDFTWSVEECLDKLDCRSMPYEDELMIGRCPFSMKPDQTLNEFKLEICEDFKQLGMDLKPEDLGQIEECWMDN